jgi:hypothetical protein
MSTDESREESELADVLSNVLTLSLNESRVVAQLEALGYFSPMPADIPRDDDAKVLKGKLDQLTENLGGPPSLIITKIGDAAPEFDFYIDAAIDEFIATFDRARMSVCRAHLFLIGNALIAKGQASAHLPHDPDIRDAMISEAVERFWEHAETAYIRLGSYWDRAGQILDFAFFNIRQYERDGFAAVMDRIRTNIVPVSVEVEASPVWKRMRDFQKSQRKDGLQWLVRRRNLLVHSLHLGPAPEDPKEDPIFTVAYNHLNEAARSKLKTGTPEEEISALHDQLARAAMLFENVVNLALLAPVSLRRELD